MFNHEFRYLYLLIQEERNHIVAAICVCSINAFVICLIAISEFKVISYTGVISKYVWSALWNLLTPRQQWLELTLIISSIAYAVMIFIAFEGILNIIDKNFEKIKAEIAKKDERIRELESKLMETNELKTEKVEKAEN